jgi:hypothetical protein
MHRPSLQTLNRGFRTQYLDYETLLQQLEGWTWAFPDLVRLKELERTAEGRRVWVLTIGPEPDRKRPALWIDANMHASELCGSNVALAFAEAVLALHVGQPGSFDGLPAAIQATIRETLIHVCPRISPDGAEAVLTTGRWVRSVPREDKFDANLTRWRSHDVDGDGRSLLLRKQDPTGEFVEGDVPGMMLLRTLEDTGPFYKVWPEGSIEHFDGHHVPNPTAFDDNYPDLNRNFPYNWANERDQEGAGEYPGSEPESRAVLEFARRHPNLFAWVNLHTFGGVGIRPLGDGPDGKLDPSDLAIYRQVGEWLEAFTGYPMVSGFEEFTYHPETPIRGTLSEWAHGDRGCVAFVVELWDLFARIGQERPKRFVERYNQLTREHHQKLAAWDREHNQGRVFRGWTKVTHPQLGDVEVGGIDPVIGLWNPPPELLGELCDSMIQVVARLCAMAPRLRARADVERIGPDLSRLTVTVENVGYLPTFVLAGSKGSGIDAPIVATVTGVSVDGPARAEIGHLDGWGRGKFDGTDTPYVLRGRGTTSRRVAQFLVRGSGAAAIRVGSPRTGWVDVAVALP